MNMEMPGIEMVTKSDLLGLDLASWDRPRSSEQLLELINRREAAIADKNEDT